MLTYIAEDGLMLGGVREMLKPCSNCPGLSTVNQDELYRTGIEPLRHHGHAWQAETFRCKSVRA